MNIDDGLLFLPRVLLSRKLRGGTRLTKFIADRFTRFRCYKASVPGGFLFVDLRRSSSQGYINEVRLNEEHVIIKKFLHNGGVGFDIGANVGLYTVWMSTLVGADGKVFAFEPNPAHVGGLSRTVGLLANAEVLNVGLSDHQGSSDLFVPEDDTMASLSNWTKKEGGSVCTELCSVTTIDRLVEEGRVPRPDFIKCDIEGGEVDCFRGAERTLTSDDAPVILFEANINSTRAFDNPISSGMDFLAALDKPSYRFFLVKDNASLAPIDSIDFLHGNILAVPASRQIVTALLDA